VIHSLSRGAAEIFPASAGGVLCGDRPLRVKLGIDPTGTDIHLGHSVLFRKLRELQDAGHTAVLVIGDFTARIGDPTGKSETRPQLSATAVHRNALRYLEQLRPILDFQTPGRLEVRYNSQWLSNLDLTTILELLSNTTVGQMLAKEDFSQRYGNGSPIYLHEFLYPLMQGFDSVAVKADLELGGTDQKFNITVGRDLQRYFGQEPQAGLLMPILVGLDGVQKMSKSLGNYVGIGEDALSMYSKLEKVPDHLLDSYFELLTDIPLGAIPTSHREKQKLLALEIVRQYHGTNAATHAQKAAKAVHQDGQSNSTVIPNADLSFVLFPAKAFYLVHRVGLCASSSDARRLIESGGVRIDGQRVIDPHQIFESIEVLRGKVLQIGRTKLIRL
jgi:tyrosyl-tRNA synthetase